LIRDSVAIVSVLLSVCALFVAGSDGSTDPSAVAGVWRGYWVGDLEVRLVAEFEGEGGQLAARSIWWSRMPEEIVLLASGNDGAEKLKALELPRHAWLGTVDFAVSFDGAEVRFEKTEGLNLYPRVAEPPSGTFTMAGEYKKPGLIVGTDPVGGMLLLWKDGALDEPLPLDLKKAATHRVRCLDNPAWGYRVYVPESYDPGTPTPVLMNCSPSRDALPLSTTMADELGWIMIGLTERENRKGDVERHNRAAVMFDIRRRFNVDWERFYACGFSGGARCAALTAVKYPDLCHGVICIGAGYGYDGSGQYEYPPYDTPVAFVIGEQDELCYREVIALYGQEKDKRDCTLIVHPGGHTWARPEDHEAAIRWLNDITISKRGERVQARPRGYVPPDKLIGSYDTSDTVGVPEGERADTGPQSTEGTCRRPRHVYPQ
jgi:dienelactone hydrolase